MTTQAQILANRRNAQKSTGPTSPKGKTAASRNSLKHGLTSAQTVINTEDQAEFDRYRKEFLEELNPETPMESMLAERVINLSWRLKRTAQIQNQAINALNTPKPVHPLLAKLQKQYFVKGPNGTSDNFPELPLGRLAIKDFSNGRVLEKLLMYERRLESSLYKTIIELQRLNLLKNLKPDTVTQLKHLANYQSSL
jgi:hypothetical protein